MTRLPRSLRLVAAATLSLAAGLAGAETSPYYIGVTQAFSYDSNVFRLPDAFAQSSTWGSTGLVAGFDQPYRRQRFFGSANVQYNYYQQLSELDNTSYALNAGWDWETIERLSGTLAVSFNQNLGNYGGANDTLIRTKNIRTGSAAFGTVNYGLLSLVQFFGRLGYSSVHYSAPQYARYELDQAAATLGVRKQFAGQLTLGTGLTYTKGDYFSFDQEFDRYDIFASANWVYSGLSTLSGRLNYSQWDYSGTSNFDRSSVTGWARWFYKPTGKLDFSVLASYDTLANSGLTDVGTGAPSSLGDTSQLTAGLRLAVGYAFSSKINVNAGLNYYRRNNDRSTLPPIGLPGIATTRDQVTAATLGATWTPTRNWLLACNLSLNDRNESGTPGITLTPYSSYGASCSAQFALQ